MIFGIWVQIEIVELVGLLLGEFCCCFELLGGFISRDRGWVANYIVVRRAWRNAHTIAAVFVVICFDAVHWLLAFGPKNLNLLVVFFANGLKSTSFGSFALFNELYFAPIRAVFLKRIWLHIFNEVARLPHDFGVLLFLIHNHVFPH